MRVGTENASARGRIPTSPTWRWARRP